MEIIPSVLTDDKGKFADYIKKLNDVILPHGFPLKRVQIDINDGSFLGTKTVEPEEMSQLENKFAIDYHLMVTDPAEWVDRCAKGKADRIIAQVEKMPDQLNYFEKVNQWNLGVGLALDFPTEIHEIHPEVLPQLDVILLMSYSAGYGGQEFNNQIFNKIRELKEKKNQSGYKFSICIDGGITLQNINQLKISGADEVSIGKRLIEEDIEVNFEKFYKAMY
ncbi:MAG TPA: hypothetical protein VI819_03190 [Patescibacteria group bacterium]|nr:hypothetical protein [Patescibacteria group bacterium]